MKYTLKYTGKFIELRQDYDSGWEWVGRMSDLDIVSILALTENGEVILIEQHRIPIDQRIIESPAGLVDEGESIEEAGKRELMEETGYESDQWSLIYSKLPNSAGLTNETTSKYLALNCKKTGKGGGIDSEDITVHLVKPENVLNFLNEKQKEGVTYDPKILTGLYLFNSQTTETEYPRESRDQ